MGYTANWAMPVDGEDLDPFEVARRAQELIADPRRGIWLITDLESGATAAVDLIDRQVIRPKIIGEVPPPPDDDEPPF